MIDFLTGLWAERFLLAGVIGGILGVAAFAPYVRDILAGRSQPDRACWLIWAGLASLSGGSNLYEGASTSMGFVGVQVAGTLVVFALSLRFGTGPLMSPTNLVILSVTALGMISWTMMETALYALILSIGISALGGARTVWKTYVSPETETDSAWVLLLVSSLFGVVSVGQMDALLLAYPVYLLVLYASIVGAGVLGRHVQAQMAQDAAWQRRRMRVPPVSLRGAVEDDVSLAA